jgi:hypothetical protein
LKQSGEPGLKLKVTALPDPEAERAGGEKMRRGGTSWH